jgi:imidazolonepropionase
MANDNTQIWRNFSQIVTMDKAHQKDGRKLRPEDLSILSNASIVFNFDEILWVGPDKDVPETYLNAPSRSFENKILLPELVDAHTHLVFGEDRSAEYVQRLNGATYEEIAAKGGGIQSTVLQTNKTPAHELFQKAIFRIEEMYEHGVGTIEIKSGYGLSYEKELELSTIINDLKIYFQAKVQILNTFMAAHAIPPNFSSGKAYLKEVVIPLLQLLGNKKIIDAVDIFHEVNYFTNEDVQLLFQMAKEYHIPVKLHADEFNNNHGAKIGAQHQALSVDHLLQIDAGGIEALANSSTVANLLPGTSFFLGKPLAPARKLLDAGAKVAIATDYNPGSCHFNQLLMLALLAAPLYRLNIAELVASITLNAAHALGLKKQGAILVGHRPRFSVFGVKNLDALVYNWGKNSALRHLND